MIRRRLLQIQGSLKVRDPRAGFAVLLSESQVSHRRVARRRIAMIVAMCKVRLRRRMDPNGHYAVLLGDRQVCHRPRGRAVAVRNVGVWMVRRCIRLVLFGVHCVNVRNATGCAKFCRQCRPSLVLDRTLAFLCQEGVAGQLIGQRKQ